MRTNSIIRLMWFHSIRDSKARSLVRETLLSTPVKEDSLRDFQRWADELIEEKSYQFNGIPGTRVDIVQNVINLVAIRWVSNYLVNLIRICCVTSHAHCWFSILCQTGLPLKTKDAPRNPFTPQEIYDKLSVLFADTYTVEKPEGGFKRHQTAQNIVYELRTLIDEKAKDTPRFGSLVSSSSGCRAS